MNNQLNTFQFQGNTPIRVIQDENGDPWWIAYDVCNVLSISNSSDAISRLDVDEHTLVSTEGMPNAKNPQVRVVNESGLYSLIMGSRKPEAKTFKKWVTSEVIPSIRKTGSYSVAPKLPQNYLEALKALVVSEEEKTLAQQQAKELHMKAMALEEEKVEIESQKAIVEQKARQLQKVTFKLEEEKAELVEELEEAAPKIELYDSIQADVRCYDMLQASRLLGISRPDLFKFLYRHDILMTGGSCQRLPYQQYLTKGYFQVKKTPYTDPKTGKRMLSMKSVITGSGVDFIRDLIKKHGGVQILTLEESCFEFPEDLL